MNKILYATDFSENSRTALKYAYELSKTEGALLVVLHVYDIPTIMNAPSNAPTFPDIERNIIEQSRKKLLDFCQIPETENIRIETRGNNSIVKAINGMIKEIHPHLVIIGTKGESKMKELIMGSTAIGLIKEAECPVLTVPDKADYNGFKHILYAWDLHEKDIDAIINVTEIASMFNSEISIVHIVTEPEYFGKHKIESFKNELLKKVSYSKLKFELLLSNDIYRELNRYVKENDINLIVMFEHEDKSIMDKWIHGDLVKQMEFHSTVPLLCYNGKSLQKISEGSIKEYTKIRK